MKRKEQIAEFTSMSKEALEEKISSVREELMNIRFRHASGQLEQTSQLNNLRKQIAQMKTVLNSSARQA